MVLSMSNAATGRRGRIAPRAALRTRVWAARSARAPKGSPVAIEGGTSSRQKESGKGASFRRNGISPTNFGDMSRDGADFIWPADSKELGAHAAEGRGGVVGNVRKWAIAVAL